MWGPVPTERVLRGGSWINNNERNARCSVRNNNHPANFNDNNGFRVVVRSHRLRATGRQCCALPFGVDARPVPDERSGGRAGPVPGWRSSCASTTCPQPNIKAAPSPVVDLLATGQQTEAWGGALEICTLCRRQERAREARGRSVTCRWPAGARRAVLRSHQKGRITDPPGARVVCLLLKAGPYP
jgi:hypothetical protein